MSRLESACEQLRRLEAAGWTLVGRKGYGDKTQMTVELLFEKQEKESESA